ncbi:hypothetical protein DTO282F9_2294 [Paecilomyces variotii]|nr:hypothetical protein DTO282F9_2294 [Paecilomyces variotii]
MSSIRRVPQTTSALLPSVLAPARPYGPRSLPLLVNSQPSRGLVETKKARKPAVAPDLSDLYQETNYLRSIVRSIPFIFEKPSAPAPAPATPQSAEFQFPLATLFKAPTRELGLSLKDAYLSALYEHGIVGIELGFEDPDSQFILDVVKTLGFEADTHSNTQGALWDVTFKPEGVLSTANGKTAHSISHSLGEFAWHTDGAFEQKPTRFFGFHIIHPDKMGGGVFRVLKAEDLFSLLSPSTVDVLTNFEFDLRVPPEFHKGVDTVKGKVLHIDSEGKPYVRYRRDIFLDPPSNNKAACDAVAELTQLLDEPEKIGEAVPSFAFKENMVLLMDNARFLHSRTDIKDRRRWLRRVRFHENPSIKA